MNRPNLITRRQFLHSAFAAIGAVTVAACGASRGSAELVIRTGGWPINTLPTKEAIAENPALQAYADALQTWLNRNPNVRIERIEASIWDTRAMLTAVAGDTAPTYFLSTVLGNWSADRSKTAFAQGLMADLTDAVANTRLNKQGMLPQYRKAWEQTGQVNGRFYYFPFDTALEDAVWYRRDLVEAAGLRAPTAGWTWDDFFDLSAALTTDKVIGTGVPWHFPRDILEAHGFGLLSEVPTPNGNWKWQLDYSDPHWANLLTRFRDARFSTGSVFSNTAFPNKQGYRDMFHAEAVAMVSTNIMSAFNVPLADTSITAIGRRNGKSYEETIGFAPLPRGDGLSVGGVNFAGGVALPPNASPELAAAAIDLVDYIYFGEAADAQKAATYEQTGDLQSVYTNPLPLDGNYKAAGVPGSFADAWGSRVFEEIQALVSLPIPASRQRTGFFPPEENVLPDNQALEDAWSQFVYVEDEMDISAEMQKAASIWNQQSESFDSSIAPDAFTESAVRYYDEMGKALKEASPDFYNNRYLPFYESKVAPIL